MALLKAPFLKKVSLLPNSQQDRFPFSVPLFRRGFELNFSTPLTIIVGENGAGKSTFLEAIAGQCGFNLGGGNKSHLFSFPETGSALCKAIKLSWLPKVSDGFFFRAESFQQFGSYIDELAKEAGTNAFRPYGSKSLNRQSHGEAFLATFSTRFSRRGLYLLDEPEAALSPQRQLALIKLLFDLSKSGNVQIIMATHSPMLMAIPDAALFEINGSHFEEKEFHATAHFQVMKRFLNDPDQMIRKLMDG